jgi:hypothetical protein
MNLYKNSGSLGDLIYSLMVIPKLGAGDFLFPIDNLKNEIVKYHGANSNIAVTYKDYFSQHHYEFCKPLLERQEYINQIHLWETKLPMPPGDLVDLDTFRKLAGKLPTGNFLNIFYTAMNIPILPEDIDTVWLSADTNNVAPIVICRTERYRSSVSDANRLYKEYNNKYNFKQNAVFIGTNTEYEQFKIETEIDLLQYQVKDYLDFANVINSAERIFSNQTFGLALATGLGKECHVELRPYTNQNRNECFWENRKSYNYF